MTIQRAFIILMLLLLTGCYPGISGKVVDGVTGTPLEGAIVLAQWTVTKGLPGMGYHSVYKIEETETDKEGMFLISGVYNPVVDPPQMVIFKKGYVPWRNDMTFKEMKLFDKNIWQDDMTYRLEQWKEGYSKERLSLFIDIMGTDYNKTPRFSKIESEVSMEAQAEVDQMKNTKK